MKHFQLANVYNVCTMCVQCVQCAHTYSTHNVYVQQLPQQSVKQFKSVERSIVWGRLASGNCFTAIITSFEDLSHLLLWTSQNIIIIIVIVLCYILIVQRLIGWCCRLCFCAHSPPFQLYTFHNESIWKLLTHLLDLPKTSLPIYYVSKTKSIEGLPQGMFL